MRLVLTVLLLAACGTSTENKPAEKPKTEAKAPPAAPVAPPAAPAAAPAPTPPAADFVPTAGPGKKVFFIDLADGAKVKSPLHVKFGAEGVDIKPAGDGTPNTGHEHIIVDGKPVPAGEVVPKDATHIHYGKGDLEADLPLTPGKHTLTLQLADGAHRSFGPALSQTITVTVE